jgi:hypothetical protein
MNQLVISYLLIIYLIFIKYSKIYNDPFYCFKNERKLQEKYVTHDYVITAGKNKRILKCWQTTLCLKKLIKWFGTY